MLIIVLYVDHQMIVSFRSHVLSPKLKALSSESFERLPVFNKSAWRHYKTSPEADDWSNPSKEPRDASKSIYKANR